ncbi:MAG: glutamate decarboxylase, partial [Firmicutes bacterium]|nr:glutamate decarboxylase [Bacillota bacterium]
MGWVVVYVAPNRAGAEMLKRRLESEGLLVAIRRLGDSVTGGKRGPCQVMVPSSEAREASELLLRSLRA